ncbi:hypothetical protein ACFLXO_00310 [Chloroflexota bacterium]
MANDTNERYLSWLVSEIGNETDYHDHKETMAWGATALYIPGIIVLAFQLPKNCFTWWPFIVVFVLVMLFINRQFHLRAKSADTNDALRKLLQDVYHGRDLQQENCSIAKGKHWPQFVEQEIEVMKGRGRSWKDFLCTDLVSYLAIIVATLIAIVIHST